MTTSRLQTSLLAAVEEAFELSVFHEVGARPDPTGPAHPLPPHVVASVGFVGSGAGTVKLHSTNRAAREIAGAMLRRPPRPVDNEMPGAIGAVTSAIARVLRKQFAASPAAWAVSVPTVTLDADLTPHPTAASRVRVPVDVDGECVYVELILG